MRLKRAICLILVLVMTVFSATVLTSCGSIAKNFITYFANEMYGDNAAEEVNTNTNIFIEIEGIETYPSGNISPESADYYFIYEDLGRGQCAITGIAFYNEPKGDLSIEIPAYSPEGYRVAEVRFGDMNSDYLPYVLLDEDFYAITNYIQTVIDYKASKGLNIDADNEYFRLKRFMSYYIEYSHDIGVKQKDYEKYLSENPVLYATDCVYMLDRDLGIADLEFVADFMDDYGFSGYHSAAYFNNLRDEIMLCDSYNPNKILTTVKYNVTNEFPANVTSLTFEDVNFDSDVMIINVPTLEKLKFTSMKEKYLLLYNMPELRKIEVGNVYLTVMGCEAIQRIEFVGPMLGLG